MKSRILQQYQNEQGKLNVAIGSAAEESSHQNFEEPRASTSDTESRILQKMMVSWIFRFREGTKKVALSKAFFYSTSFVIAVNIVSLASFSNKYPKEVKDALEMVHIICNAVYVLEILTKLCGLGYAHFWEAKMRLLEALFILSSIIDIVYNKASGEYSVGLSAIRALSLLRLLKGTKVGSSLMKTHASFMRSSTSIFSLLVVLILIMFIYAMLGNDLFKNYSKASPDKVGSFVTARDSMLFVFVLLTGEGWPGGMAELVQKVWEKNKAKTVIPLMYFLSFIVLGNFILLNIFLGIMIDNLITESAEDLRDRRATLVEEELLQSKKKSRSERGFIGSNEPNDEEQSTSVAIAEWGNNSPPVATANTYERQFERIEDSQAKGRMQKICSIPEHNALLLFSPTNKFRRICYKIVTNKIFKSMCIGAIITSTISLVFEDPLHRDEQLKKVIHYGDFFFTGKCIFSSLPTNLYGPLE